VPHTKEYNREQMRRLRADPEFKAREIERRRKQREDPLYQQKLREQQAAWLANPDVRDRRNRLERVRRSKQEFKEKAYPISNARRSYRRIMDEEFRLRGNQLVKEHYQRLRAKIIEGYGSKCTCCGEIEPRFLELDHVNGGGTQDYKKVGAHGAWRRIIKADFPPEYQLLCANCNQGRARNGGICPHKEQRIGFKKFVSGTCVIQD